MAASAGSTQLAPEAVMGRISEALVATAIGILIAIPAVAAFNAFQRIVRGTIANTEALGHVLLAHLKATPVSADLSQRPSVERTSAAPSGRGRSEKPGESERN
jgi:biopolymer transport protein ExbB